MIVTRSSGEMSFSTNAAAPALIASNSWSLVLAHREGDDPGRRDLALDALGGLDAARRGQRQVEQHDVGRVVARGVERRPRVLRLGDDVEVLFALQDLAHPDPEQRVVVDQQDLHAHIRVAPVWSSTTAIRAAIHARHP
jgi:hypothetical protein